MSWEPDLRDDAWMSKSAAKRAARQVEELAAELLSLGDAEVARLDWDEELLEELRLARRIREHGARRRQLKHLAARLRQHPEAAALAEKLLAARERGHRAEVADFHALEQLRERLCHRETVEEALCEVAAAFPGRLELKRLAALARAVQQGGDKRAYREIFRLLRDAARVAALASDDRVGEEGESS